MRHKLKIGFLVVNIVLVLCMLLAYISPSIHPEQSRIPAMLSLFFPILFFLNLFIILFWLSFGKWYALISIVCLLIGFSRIRNFIQPGIHSRNENSEVLKLATYNIYGFHKVHSDEKNAERVLLQMIKDVGNPDILCLQESVNVGRVDHAIGSYNHMYQVPKSGSLLLSKLPIIRKGQITFDDTPSLSGWVDIKSQKDTFRVYILHLTSNKITEESEELLDDPKLQQGQTWITAGGLVGKYTTATRMRADEAVVIRKHMNDCPHPVIVMGDFNDIPQSYTYSTIRGEDLNDSFVLQGRGIGTTYAGSIPGLRIDYILMDKSIPVMSHDVLKLPYSDHYPVVAEVVMNDE